MTPRPFYALLSLILLCSACAPAPQVHAPLVVYSGRSDPLLRPVMERFTEKTGIPVILHSASATELLNKLRLEDTRTLADLYVSNDAGTLQLGEDQGLFSALPVALTGTVPARFRGTRDHWLGLSGRARVLVVNTTADVDWLQSVFDLADPRLKGRLGLTNAANESFVAGVSVRLAIVGDERTRSWLAGLRDNTDDEVYPRHGAVVADVAAGRRSVGLVNHYYVLRHLADDPGAHLRMVVPDQGEDEMGVVWNVSGIAISRFTQRREAAEALVAFLVSTEGQRLFADANMEYPTVTGVPAHPALPPVGSMRVSAIPMSALAALRGPALDLIDRVGMH